MKCPKCETEMYIDSWDGWFWTCFNCGYVGRQATHEESEKQEKKHHEEYLKKSRKVLEK